MFSVELSESFIELIITPEEGTELYILGNAVVYFSDTLPSKSPILIIMYHLGLKPNSTE